jgi:hypothetical protein
MIHMAHSSSHIKHTNNQIFYKLDANRNHWKGILPFSNADKHRTAIRQIVTADVLLDNKNDIVRVWSSMMVLTLFNLKARSKISADGCC